MKNMLLVAMLAASPSVAQEFAAETRAAEGEILAQARALRASSPALHAAAAADAKSERDQMLKDIETLKGKIEKYADDAARVGIYHAELSLLYMKLALGNVRGAGAPSPSASAVETEAERGERRARLQAEIAKMKEMSKAYEGDSLRAGIYAAELGLLHMKLALVDAL